MWLVVLMAATQPWGDVLRLGPSTNEGSEAGITTLLALGTILLGIATGTTLRGVHRYPTSLIFGLVLLITGLAAFTSPLPADGLLQTIHFLAYFTVALTVAGLPSDDQFVRRIATVFAASAAIMCLCSLVDRWGVLDIARINDRVAFRNIDGDEIPNVVGPFYSQTALAAYLALAFPVACRKMAAQPVLGWRVLWLGATIAIVLAGIMTYSKTLILSFGVALCYLLYVGGRRRLIRRIVVLAVCVVLGAMAFRATAPDLEAAFVRRTTSLLPSAIAGDESDLIRAHALAETLRDLHYAPFGVGFTRVELENVGAYNVHSNVTLFLRAAGFLGVVLILLALVPIIRNSIRRGQPWGQEAAFSAVLSFMIYGVTHTTMSSLAFWIFIGLVMYASRRQLRNSSVLETNVQAV
jgi:hypothetical protein